ncbi:MAG: NAD-binding protein [Clostridia bacterium]|nr:NAD-binding protein [Clostridia bacterium]
MKISLMIFIVAILITLYIAFQKKREFKNRIVILIFGIAVSIGVLIFPLLNSENIIVRILDAVYYAIRSIWMNQDTELLGALDLTNLLETSYFVILYILFILLPILTTGAILAFISDALAKRKFRKVRNKDLYIFSELNEKSKAFARKLGKNRNSAIVFANSKNKETEIKSVRIEEKITGIEIKNRNTNIEFYAISDNEEDNINDTLELIEKYKDRENTKIYVINNTIEAPAILDSVDKGKLTVEVINETEREIFNLLDEKPLFENAIDNTISVLIIGCGKVGKEFLKNATWCSIMPGFRYKATVVDVNASLVKENIQSEAPEFLENYDIRFINGDIKTEKVMNEIKKMQDVNYILVSMESDEKNLETAILLRRMFLQLYHTKPVINLWVENEFKQAQILNLVNERGISYELNSFGSIKDMYFDNSILGSRIEGLAKQIHLAYSPDDKAFAGYNKREYFKKSSRASALHMKYKIYAILKDKFTDDMKQNQELFKIMYNKEIEEILAENEHERWNAYTRSIGYKKATVPEVIAYYPETKRHENSLARLHPALVPWNELDEVSEGLKEIIPNIDLKASDYDIVRKMCDEIKL